MLIRRALAVNLKRVQGLEVFMGNELWALNSAMEQGLAVRTAGLGWMPGIDVSCLGTLQTATGPYPGIQVRPWCVAQKGRC